MKNLFNTLIVFCLLLICTIGTSKAQSNLGTLLSTSALALDTVTNTGTEVLTLAVAGPKSSVTIAVKVLEISGTTAGAVKLYGSIDGGTTFALLDGAGTFSPTDVTTAQSYAWHVKPSAFTHYRVSYTGAGTMVASFSAKALWR